MCRSVYDGTRSQKGERIICTKEYTKDTAEITCCENVVTIPDILVNLVALDCNWTKITSIPDTLVDLVKLDLVGPSLLRYQLKQLI